MTPAMAAPGVSVASLPMENLGTGECPVATGYAYAQPGQPPQQLEQAREPPPPGGGAAAGAGGAGGSLVGLLGKLKKGEHLAQ